MYLAEMSGCPVRSSKWVNINGGTRPPLHFPAANVAATCYF
jgi:hypothetical protein